MKNLDDFKTLTTEDLAENKGGFIPLVIAAVGFTSGFGTGYGLAKLLG